MVNERIAIPRCCCEMRPTSGHKSQGARAGQAKCGHVGAWRARRPCPQPRTPSTRPGPRPCCAAAYHPAAGPGVQCHAGGRARPLVRYSPGASSPRHLQIFPHPRTFPLESAGTKACRACAAPSWVDPPAPPHVLWRHFIQQPVLSLHVRSPPLPFCRASARLPSPLAAEPPAGTALPTPACPCARLNSKLIKTQRAAESGGCWQKYCASSQMFDLLLLTRIFLFNPAVQAISWLHITCGPHWSTCSGGGRQRWRQAWQQGPASSLHLVLIRA